jgi:hypothetical protein
MHIYLDMHIRPHIFPCIFTRIHLNILAITYNQLNHHLSYYSYGIGVPRCPFMLQDSEVNEKELPYSGMGQTEGYTNMYML